MYQHHSVDHWPYKHKRHHRCVEIFRWHNDFIASQLMFFLRQCDKIHKRINDRKERLKRHFLLYVRFNLHIYSLVLRFRSQPHWEGASGWNRVVLWISRWHDCDGLAFSFFANLTVIFCFRFMIKISFSFFSNQNCFTPDI